MKQEYVILNKPFASASEVMRVAKLIRVKRGYDLALQLRRARTNIGANVEEAQAA